MRLKKIVLQGYKTFATKTEFQFDEGITAIVGPNGSGKSNIADALRWVLGEQSYSTLRGKRTTDMIFAGSQSRPRAGMAQTILTLDNSDGWLPIDYTEVEICRRAYRSGENEYLLNGQKVRLKDVADLLATSGLAERTYTIIGQGLVDQALSLRSEERRALFEEAAGINHYKSRRAETLRRLQETQRNLQRVHDILAEIRPRLGSLKRQATRARNYEQIATDLNHLLAIWYGYKWEQAKKNLRAARTAAETIETQWQTTRTTLRVRQENADDLRRRIHRLEQQLGELQTQRDAHRDQVEAARREAAILQERRALLQRQLAEVAQDLPGLESQTAVAQADLTTALTDLQAAQTELAASQEQLQSFNATFQTQQATINQWQGNLRDAEKAQRDTQTRIAQTQGQLNQLKERLKEQEASQQQAGGSELTRLQQDIERLTAVTTASQQKADELNQQRKTAADQRQELINNLKTMRRDLRDAENNLNRQRNELARLEARTDMLDQLRTKEIKASQSVTTLGNLAGFLTIPAHHQTAVQAILAHRLATLLLPHEADLWQLLSEQDGQTAVAVIAQSHITPPPALPTPADPAVLGWAADLVSCQPIAEPVVRLLLGHVLLVQDAASAYRLAQTLPPGAVAVAANGLLAHAGGLVEAGGSQQNSILARETDWRQAQTQLTQRKTELAELETAVSTQQTAVQEQQAQADALQTEEQRLTRLINEAAQRTSQAQRDLDRQKQQLTYLDRQRQTQAQEIGRLQLRIEEMEDQLENDWAKLVKLEANVSAAQTHLATLPITEAQQQRDGLRQSITTVQTIVAGRQAVVDSRRATLNQFERQLARLTDQHTRLLKEQEQLDTQAQNAAQQQVQEKLTELDARLEPLKARLTEARTELARWEEDTAVAQKAAHEAETQYTQTRITLTQRNSEIENLQERIKADLGVVALHYDEDQTGPTPLPISGIAELPVVTELPNDIESTIHEYRAQLHRMGAINPDAPQEYEETQSRHDFLEGQIDDLNKTEEQLRKIIAELDELTSRAFAETVEKVNAVFGGIFTQLFGGGAARLLLTDPDDLTISGVDIIARLPGRREQALGLLSGGERSLTAVALIFSLLKVSPTPFCVMDEVDAALDEANVNRFRELLRELSLTTQFVIITHNRGTVQAAQTIYGISMGTDSASQAISIKPEDYVKQAELI